MSPKLSALGKVLLVPSKAPPCDTQPSTFSHVIISRSPLTRPSKPDLIPKGLFPSLMHVRTNDLTGRKKKNVCFHFGSQFSKHITISGKKDLKAFACASLFLFNIVCNWLLFLSVLPTYLKDQSQVLEIMQKNDILDLELTDRSQLKNLIKTAAWSLASSFSMQK